ncbi:MAG: hypothetical protein AB9869_15775 [Verrucomicrobiia bacterium]
MTPRQLTTMVNSSDFKFSCPFCQQHLACEDDLRGSQIQCPACKAQITIPALLGLAAHAASKDHAVGNYIPPVMPGEVRKIRVKKA